jgi:hypothetical protein
MIIFVVVSCDFIQLRLHILKEYCIVFVGSVV